MKIGNIVMCRRSLSEPWRGPFVLVEQHGYNTYIVGGGETFPECRLAKKSELP